MRPLLLPLLFLLLAATVFGQVDSSGDARPPTWRTHLPGDSSSTVPSALAANVYATAHNQGNIQISVSNTGKFGFIQWPEYPWFAVDDPFTGAPIHCCTYPRGRDHAFVMDSYFWVGGIREGDTAVVDEQWQPDETEYRPFGYQSVSKAMPAIYSTSARSDLDIFCAFTDTSTDRLIVGSNYHPTYLKVKQRSMAWGGAGADDFVLVECELKNLGPTMLRKIWCGVTFNNDVRNIEEISNADDSYSKFLTGYLPFDVVDRRCLDPEKVDLAYVMSADGRPFIKQWTKYSSLAAVGARFIAMPLDTIITNYNWETYTSSGWFSPRLRGTPGDPFRPYGNWGPWNNRGQKYHFLSHKEIDYDQMFAAVNHYADGWYQPASNATTLASGAFAWATISAGGFDLAPGASAKVVYAIVGGDSVLTSPTGYENIFTPEIPDEYYKTHNFSALTSNARWARRVYDNPGVDTDGDGYAGEYAVCDGDTLWISGDGVPDFRADSPPPAPELHVIPSEGKLTLRWNGFLSETTADPFTRVVDFEGYNVYFGLDARPSSLTLCRSYDRENFIRYQLFNYAYGQYEWRATDIPLSLDSLHTFYNDPEFNPYLYTRVHPLSVGDKFFYFEPQGHNASQLLPEGVHKVYPDAALPSNDSTQWSDDEVTTEHGRRLPKYYEYEYTVEHLLPTVQYFVNVTAFDFGYAVDGLAGLESAKESGLVNAFAIPLPEVTAATHAAVYTWPNPYRFDGNYVNDGYENRAQNLWRDRAHVINFGNLPAKCTISIFSLDGDLVQTIKHDLAPDDPEASHASWDLVTRNIQLAVSGIYYWVVESAVGNQIGKIVIIE